MISRQGLWGLFAAVLFFIAANLFTILFIRAETYLYYWDLANYWTRLIDLADAVRTDPYSALRGVVHSIRHDDYNDLPTLLLLPATTLLGQDRLGFILAIVNVFGVATALSFCLAHRAMTELSRHQSLSAGLSLIPVGILLLSPAFWSPVLYGYPDVGGLVLVNLVFFVYLREPFSGGCLRDALLIALLVPLPVLFRRWYAYWAVSFYAALVVERCYSLRSTRLAGATRTFCTIVLQGAVSAIVVFIAAPSFSIRAATTNYGDIYSAYRLSVSLAESLARTVNYFGSAPFALFVAGAVQLARSKATRHVAIMLGTQWLLIQYAFSRTQDFGHQHFYLLLPTILFCSAHLITQLVRESKTLVVAGGLAVLLMLNIFTAFHSGAAASGGEPRPAPGFVGRMDFPYLFTGLRHPPLVREDISEIDRMLTVLGEVLVRPGDRVYVLASSHVLNSSILGSAHLSLKQHREVAGRILPTHDVDLRDGFPAGLLRASHVLVAEPVQYHLRPQDQRVVGIPAELILAGQGIGVSLTRLPQEFSLERGVKCYLYVRREPFRESDLQLLSDTLRSYYPDRPGVFRRP